MLSEKAKARRRKLSDVNIKVSFIAWLIEFLALFVGAAIPLIVGQGHVAHPALQIISHFLYFVLLPFCYLVNSSDIKNAIVDESWFQAIRGIFNRTNIQVLRN